MLTTGDLVTAERKHGQPFRFRSYARLLFSANEMPTSRDKTYAFYRRWVIIPFQRTFNFEPGNSAPDLGLRDKLMHELPGILNRALRGLARLVQQAAFTQPASVLAEKEAYMHKNDNVRAFAEECLTADTHGSIIKRDLYRVYAGWCASAGERPVSQKILREGLVRSFPRLDEWRPAAQAPWRWLGIAWSIDPDDYLDVLPPLKWRDSRDRGSTS
jgi:putative DNA primase/helicase